MDKLRKIGELFWYNKERIVLAIMVAVLGWHLYRLFSPVSALKQEVHKYPCAQDCDLPHTKIPDPPEVRTMMSWKPIYTPNPFWYYAIPASKDNKEEERKGVGIVLLKIAEKGAGQYRAQLQTTARKWYSEGDKFEQFELRKIDPDAETCDVYSERLGKVITLTISGK